MKKIAIIDPASYTLPYDYFYITEISKYYEVDFYYSNTKYNYEYIKKLESNQNVHLLEYNISTSVISKAQGFLNYIRMLIKVLRQKETYYKIHFMWNLFLPLEKPFFKLLDDKFIFTFHNNVPHSFDGSIFKPYATINHLASKKVFVSKFTQEQFLKSYDNSGQYFLLNHGIMLFEDKTTHVKNKKEIRKEICFWGRVEEYKGVDIFLHYLQTIDISIYGKWNKNLENLKKQLDNKNNIQIIDDYLSSDELINLLTSETIFILPYKDATQSGVLYTLLAYEKVFISSDVGENSKFLVENSLSELVFNRDDEKSILKAINYAKVNYFELKDKLRIIKDNYEWKNIMTEERIKDIYDD